MKPETNCFWPEILNTLQTTISSYIWYLVDINIIGAISKEFKCWVGVIKYIWLPPTLQKSLILSFHPPRCFKTNLQKQFIQSIYWQSFCKVARGWASHPNLTPHFVWHCTFIGHSLTVINVWVICLWPTKLPGVRQSVKIHTHRTRFDNATRFFDFHWTITLSLILV
jgi:hypothetical protein